jgi:ketosteroid isomerase-like protein
MVGRCSLVALSGALFLVACGPAPVDVAAETKALVARSEAVSAAEAAKDREKALTFWAPDATVQPSAGPQIQGRDAVSKMYQFVFDSTGLKSFSGQSAGFVVAASGDIAYETGVNRMTFGTPKGDVLDVGKYLAVWKKTDGTWYIAALAFSSDAPAPVPVPK